MNEEHVQDELLQRHFDGDLRPGSAAQVEQHLSGCAECSKRQRALVALHGMVEMAAGDSARGVDFEALYGRIERGIREQRAPSLGERVAVWWRDLAEQRPGQLWVPAGAGLAAAAVALLMVFRGVEPGPRTSPHVETQVPGEPPGGEHALEAAPAPQALAAAAGSSEVVQVDFGSNAGTVFEIALADGKSTPVVWINDEL